MEGSCIYRIEKMLLSPSIKIFTQIEKKILAVNYIFRSDSITLDRYVFSIDKINSGTISPDFTLIPYMINMPDGLCIESFNISKNKKFSSIRIFINKKF